MCADDDVVRLLQLPPRPVDWEQDVIQTAQAHMLKTGRDAEKTFQNLAGGKREVGKDIVAAWLRRVDASLRLSEIEHLCNMFQVSPTGGISRQAFVDRFSCAAEEDSQSALRWLRNQLYEKRTTLDQFLLGADMNRDGKVSKDELVAAIQRIDPILSDTAVLDLVRSLCPADPGPLVDLRSLRHRLKLSSAQEADREHTLLQHLRAALRKSGARLYRA